MGKILDKLKIEAQQIKGSDFQNWYEGLSPIRRWLYGEWING